MNLNHFLEKNHLLKKDLKTAGLSWEQLLEIEEDYNAKKSFYHTIAGDISAQLMKVKRTQSRPLFLMFVHMRDVHLYNHIDFYDGPLPL